MSDDGSILAKKLASARALSAPLPQLNDVMSIFTKNLEKRARVFVGSVVETLILDAEIKKFSDVLDGISMPAMIGLVAMDDVDRSCLVNLDLDLTYHVVDLKMGGLSTELPEFGARRPTSIDCSICRDLANIALDSFVEAISDMFRVPKLVELSCTEFEHMPMTANIVPDQTDVLFVRISMDIGEAARSGNLDLVIPLAALDGIQARLQRAFSVNSGAQGDAWAEHMLDVVLDTEVQLTPQLFSSEFNVGELSRMQVGQVLPLNPNAHNNIELRLQSPTAKITLARARLGSWKGRKALKLLDDPSPEFLEPLREVVEQKPAAEEAAS